MALQTVVYLITGANRGIGLALVAELAAKDEQAFIYAGVRDPAKATALQKLSSVHSGKIEIVKYVAGDVAGNKAIADSIHSKHGVIDIVVACAGIATYMGPVLETPPQALQEHFETNVVGVNVLFQALHLLLRASKTPKFIPLSSPAGSLTAYISMPAGYTCYGASKVALNYVARKIHFENDWITCFPLSPGIVKTDMAAMNREMDTTGTLAPIQDQMAISPEQCATSLVKLIHKATREKDGGEFINIDGANIPW